MVSNTKYEGVPEGKIVPFYLTNEGDVFALVFHDPEELEYLGYMIASRMGNKIPVDTRTQVNDPMYKFTAYEMETMKRI